MITFHSTTVPVFVKERSGFTTIPVPVKSFESLIPALTDQFRRACRYMNANDREEAIQDMLASAFANYKSLVDRGLYDNIYSTPLGSYAIRSYRAGRRFYGNRSKDVMDPVCQIKGRADVRGHVYYDANGHHWVEVLIYDRTHDPALVGELNVDYENWRQTLNNRQCDFLDAFLRGEATNEIARNFNLSPGRISQIRRELLASWNDFVGNETSID